jgi:Repeat of unknown function (DUF5648)
VPARASRAFYCLSQPRTDRERSNAEYFHAGWGYYFVTAFPAEISALDGGAFGGVWQRTGQTFPVGASQDAGTSPVCRFFSTSFAPRSSHFYTPFPAECETVKSNHDWQYEAISFHLKTPDGNGTCPAASAPLYRLYNNGSGGAPNHRYATSRTTVDQMRARGWISEDNGADGTIACTPSTGGVATAEGVWTGTTDRNETVRAIILDDGTYYMLYSKPGTATDAGVFQGSGSAVGGIFSSSDGKDFPIPQGATLERSIVRMSLSGSYVPRTNLQLTITDAGGARSLVATHVSGSGQPASLAAAAGQYTGFTGHAAGGKNPASFTLDASGNIAGGSAFCSFQGTLTPNRSVNVFDWVQRAPGGCSFGKGPIFGIIHYDEATGQLRGFAPFDLRSDQFYLIGTKQ